MWQQQCDSTWRGSESQVSYWMFWYIKKAWNKQICSSAVSVNMINFFLSFWHLVSVSSCNHGTQWFHLCLQLFFSSLALIINGVSYLMIRMHSFGTIQIRIKDQMNVRWIHFGQGFINCFNVPRSKWFWSNDSDPDYPKGTHS